MRAYFTLGETGLRTILKKAKVAAAAQTLIIEAFDEWCTNFNCACAQVRNTKMTAVEISASVTVVETGEESAQEESNEIVSIIPNVRNVFPELRFSGR